MYQDRIEELEYLLAQIEEHRIIELEHEGKPLTDDVILKYCNQRTQNGCRIN